MILGGFLMEDYQLKYMKNLKIMQKIFFLGMVAHNFCAILLSLVLLFEFSGPLIVLIYFFPIYWWFFYETSCGTVLFLISIIGTIFTQYLLKIKFNQEFISNNVIASSIIITLICGYVNFCNIVSCI